MRVGLAAALAAPAVVQVREIELLHVVLAHQRQQGGQLWVVVLRERGAQPDANAVLAAQVDGVHRGDEAALELAPLVMNRFQAVDADADIVVLRRSHLLDIALVDQRAVGRQRHEEALFAGMGGELEDVVPQQRLATGKDQHTHTGFVQIVDDLQGFARIQLVAKFAVGGGGVAVLAGQVAAPQQIPDNHRWACAAGAAGAEHRQGRPGQGTQVMADSQHRVSPQEAAASWVNRWLQHYRGGGRGP